ncbi:MAG: hypothetical protein J5875_06925 [Paludibacteraceae bacterium]|nr:hypothetical protein [Paludibacteraceae bacterium]
MKKILILLYLAFSQNVFCYVGNKKIQTELPKNEISVSYGVFSIYTLLDGIQPGLHIQDCESDVESTLLSKTGALSLEYSYTLSNKARIGLIGSYMGFRHEVKTGDKTGEIPLGELKSQFFGILPKIQLYWFYHERVAMYSKFAIGVALNTRKMTSTRPDLYESFNENNVKFEFQISPISFEAGGEQLRGFAELGFGNYLMAAGLKLYW